MKIQYLIKGKFSLPQAKEICRRSGVAELSSVGEETGEIWTNIQGRRTFDEY